MTSAGFLPLYPPPPDMYVTCTSFVHKVCPDGYFIALVSTTVARPPPNPLRGGWPGGVDLHLR